MNSVSPIKSNRLSQAVGIKHGFFTREGGVSQGIYKGLNCGPGSRDAKDNVIENRKRALRSFDLEDSNKLHTLYQVHSPDVVTLTSDNLEKKEEADAWATNLKGQVLGILTADCTPVLFCDPENQVIGAAHAGWKGAISGILENTVIAMENLGANRENIIAAIGPTIHQESYQVGEGFLQTFIKVNESYKKFFIQSDKKDFYQFDLPGFNNSKLKKLGLATIDNVNKDTYANKELFYSWRRTCHEGNDDYGRLLSAIMLD